MKVKKSLLKTTGCSAATLALLAYGAAAQAQAFTETFGIDAGRVSNDYVPGGNFTYKATGVVENGEYTVMPPQAIVASTGSAYWTDLIDDHTGGGALMVLNAGTDLLDIYVRDFNVQPGLSYRISAWRYVVNGDRSQGTPDLPISWSLQVRDTSNDEPLVESGSLASSAIGEWIESVYEFTVPMDCNAVGGNVPARLAVTNQSPINSGNDFYVDDISVEAIPIAAGQAEFCPTGRTAISATAVPTLGTVGLGLLGLLSAGLGALNLRGRKRTQ